MIKLYPLFGFFRAECDLCKSYGNSTSPGSIAEALKALCNNEHTFRKEAKNCKHTDPSYASGRTRIDYKHLPFIKDVYKTDGCKTFPKIWIGGRTLKEPRVLIDVTSASSLPDDWSAYLYCNVSISNQLPAKKLHYVAMSDQIIDRRLKELSKVEIKEKDPSSFPKQQAEIVLLPRKPQKITKEQIVAYFICLLVLAGIIFENCIGN